MKQARGTATAQGIFNDLFWIQDPAAVTTIPAAEGTFIYPPVDLVSRFNSVQMNAIETYASSIMAAVNTLQQ